MPKGAYPVQPGYRDTVPPTLKRGGRSIPAVILVLLALLLPEPARTFSGHPVQGDYLITVSVDPSAPGKRIPTGFLGISHEWDQAQIMIGDPEAGSNGIYRQLVANLLAAGAGHLVIRIGGTSTSRIKKADPRSVRPLEQLFGDLNAGEPQVSFILGIGMVKPEAAAGQAHTLLSGMPAGAVSALEIGNEPDTYPALHLRPEGYSFPDYLAEWRSITEAIRKAVPAAPGLLGPSLSRNPGSGFGATANYQKLAGVPGLTMLTQHVYFAAGTACGGDARPGMLLQPEAAAEGPRTAADLLRTVRKPWRITEMNAFNCPDPGISNSFEAALWLSDILFEYARTGISGINIHVNNQDREGSWDPNGAFQFHVPDPQYQLAGLAPPPGGGTTTEYALKAVLPLYYGMLLFAEAAPMKSSLLPADVKTEANIKAWTTRDETTGELKVLLINKETDLPGKAGLSVPGYRSAKIKRLMAPSFRSQSGITYGGQTFDGSRDGKPLGKAETELLTPRDSVFEVPLGPASAVLITFER